MNHEHQAMYQHHGQLGDEMGMIQDGLEPEEYAGAYPGHQYPEEDELTEGMVGTMPRAVHQCNVCNKIFVSFKGLQQHSVIHTDQKPFQCDICGKSFRFKSNLFEHRSVHTGFTPHACPYCGKTCRLKGNLKKHLKTHVSTKEELEEAWRPFASNRRPPQDIPEDAIVVRGTGEPFFTPPSRHRKRKLGLGADPRNWVDKIRRGDLLPPASMADKLRRLEEAFKDTNLTLNDVLELGKACSFEQYDCPVCKAKFMSRHECAEHLEVEHPMIRNERPLWCEPCMKSFADSKTLEQHESYHKRVHIMMENGEIEAHDPEIMVPDITDVVQDNLGMLHDDMLQ